MEIKLIDGETHTASFFFCCLVRLITKFISCPRNIKFLKKELKTDFSQVGVFFGFLNFFYKGLGEQILTSFYAFLRQPLKNGSSYYQAIQVANTKVDSVFYKGGVLELALLYQNSENRIVSLTRISGQQLFTWNAFNSI